MTRTFAIAAWVATSIAVAELLGYLLHRLLHTGWIPWLSMSHMKHHMILYGPLKKQRPSEEYLDATTGRVALGNIGLEWIAPSAVILAVVVVALQVFRVAFFDQAVSIGTILMWTFLMFSYLHDRMHIQGFWMERAPILRHWFCWARNLHDIHHRVLNDQGLMDKNFGIGLAFFDWLFGTMAPVQPPFNHAGLEAARERFEFVARGQSDIGRY
jgi:sterol desaturase/sphingolipid hydroxylase (fatty acid hydroxylase superfamily)